MELIHKAVDKGQQRALVIMTHRINRSHACHVYCI